MKQIENIDLTKLHTDVVLGFFLQIAEKTSFVTVEAEQIVITAFKNAVTAFNEVMRPDVINSFTATRKAADEKTDNLCVGIRKYVDALTYSPNYSASRAAKKAIVIIDKYGNLTRMGYKEQYPNLQSMLNDLKEIPVEERDDMMLLDWIDALDNACANFLSITSQKVAEDSLKQVGIVQDLRDAAEVAYYAMVSRINAGALYLGDTEYAEFIDNVNVIVGEYKTMIAAAKTRAENKKVDGEDSPVE